MGFMKFREPNQVKWVGVRPGHNGEQVHIRAPSTLAAILLYTVPTGKTLLFYNACIIKYNSVAGNMYIAWYSAGAVLKMEICGAYCIGSSHCVEVHYNAHIPIEIPSGEKIYCDGTVGLGRIASFHGVLIDN